MSKLRALIAIFLFSVLGCGTDTGNPGYWPASSGLIMTVFVEQTVDRTCTKLRECHPGLTEDDCRHGLYNLDNLDTSFGLQDGVYATFADVAAAELKGQVTPHNSAAVTCLDNVATMNCGDPLITQAYQPQAPNKFGEVYKIFTPVCQGVY